jgi:hypothetical protein
MNCTEVRSDFHTLGVSHAGRSHAHLQTPSTQMLRPLASQAPVLANITPPLADPWLAVIASLSEYGRQPLRSRRRQTGTSPLPRASSKARPAATKGEHGRSIHKKDVRVSFVERLGARSISITWHDSTAACYAEQLWMRRAARSSGLCALTGMMVRRGDSVYSPASRAAIRPLNCTQMILAAAVEDLERA